MVPRRPQVLGWKDRPGPPQVQPPPQSRAFDRHWFRSTWATSFRVILHIDHYSTSWGCRTADFSFISLTSAVYLGWGGGKYKPCLICVKGTLHMDFKDEDEHEHLHYKGSSKRTEKRGLERGTKKKYLYKSLSPVAAWGASALDSVHSELHLRKTPRSLNKVDVSNLPPVHPPASRKDQVSLKDEGTSCLCGLCLSLWA